jgi:hypothetical protein
MLLSDLNVGAASAIYNKNDMIFINNLRNYTRTLIELTDDITIYLKTKLLSDLVKSKTYHDDHHKIGKLRNLLADNEKTKISDLDNLDETFCKIHEFIKMNSLANVSTNNNYIIIIMNNINKYNNELLICLNNIDVHKYYDILQKIILVTSMCRGIISSHLI